MEPGFRVGAGRYAIVFERDFFSAPPASAEEVPDADEETYQMAIS